MTRTFSTFALAALAATTFLASSAEACISCNYVPEVVNTPSPYDTKRFQKKREAAAQPQRATAPAKQRIAETAPKKVEAAKKTEAAKPIETAEATPLETEGRSVSTASLIENRGRPAEETKVAQDVGCKKFFPTIGQTLTVPCE
jgi:hypothetical protein